MYICSEAVCTLLTDLQPLTMLVSLKKEFLHWLLPDFKDGLLKLSECSHDIRYCSTKKIADADALSCLPLKNSNADEEEEATLLNVVSIEIERCHREGKAFV